MSPRIECAIVTILPRHDGPETLEWPAEYKSTFSYRHWCLFGVQLWAPEHWTQQQTIAEILGSYIGEKK